MKQPTCIVACLVLLSAPIAAADSPLGPSAPQNATAKPGPGVGAITLTWDPAQSLTGLTAYRVYAVQSDGARVLLASTNPSNKTFVEEGLPAGQTRTYVVTAVDLIAESSESAQATATTFTAPGSPRDVAAAPGALGSLGEVAVSWQAPESDGGSQVTAYSVYRDGVLVAVLDASTSWTDTGVDVTADHTYAVSAMNLVGEGPQSDAVCARASPWISSCLGVA